MNDVNRGLFWVESSGGPLVVIPAAHAIQWQGIESADYDDACEIDDYSGLIIRKWGIAIVLGDEPLRTTAIECNSEIRIARWKYAPDTKSLVELAERRLVSPPVESLRVDARAGRYRLLDSAAVGRDECGGQAEFSLPYDSQVLTTHVLDQDETGVIIHRFEKK